MATEHRLGENKRLVERWMDEAWNKHTAKVDDYCAGNCVVHDPVSGLITGVEGVQEFVNGLRGAFPDIRLSIDDLIAEGDQVVCRVTVRGTHQGPFVGITATGKSMTMTATVTFRIENGQFVEVWQDWDALGVLQQIGSVKSWQALAAAGE